jgi:hypothetical protein
MTRDNRKRYHPSKMRHYAFLADMFNLIEQADEAGHYEDRNRWIYHALSVAISDGLEAGIRIDPEEPEWPVIFFELPTGQVSWHVPQHPHSWDGHTHEEKYERIHSYTQSLYKRPAR